MMPSARQSQRPRIAMTVAGIRTIRKPANIAARMTSDRTARCASMKARSASIMSAVLPAVEQYMVGEEERHNLLDHRCAPEPHKRPVPGPGSHMRRLAPLVKSGKEKV